MNPTKLLLQAFLIAIILSNSIRQAFASGKPTRCKADLIALSEQIAVQFDGTSLKIPFADVPVEPASLFAAHRTGYLPERNAVWDLPEYRGIISLEHECISESSRRLIARAIKNGLRITWNSATEHVVDGCASMTRAGDNSEWMTSEVVSGYKELYRFGFVYSVELWSSDGILLAGDLGIISNGHVQGVSRFRNITHVLSDGGGHVINSAMKYYFWSRGLKVFDDEVPRVAGGIAKHGVQSESRADFAQRLKAANLTPPIYLNGAQDGQPLPSFESDFFQQFLKMRETGNYRFESRP